MSTIGKSIVKIRTKGLCLRWKSGMCSMMPLLMVCLLLLVMTVSPICANALDGAPVSGETKRVEVTLDALAEMREGAKVVTTFQKGDHIFLTEETEDWYTVYYQGSFLYIKKGSGNARAGTGKSGRSGSTTTQSMPELSDIATEEFERELQEESAANEVRVEELEMYREGAQRARVWRTVIIVVVAAIVLGVVVSSVLRGRRRRQRSKRRQGERSISE